MLKPTVGMELFREWSAWFLLVRHHRIAFEIALRAFLLMGTYSIVNSPPCREID